MQYGLCTLSMIPLRATAGHGAEQVSQVLFGETYRVVSTDGEWLRIITNVDLYEGYIPANQHTPLSAGQFLHASHEHRFLMKACVGQLSDNSTMHLHPGSFLPFLSDTSLLIPQKPIVLNNPEIGPASIKEEAWMALLKGFLNTPYCWGGKTPFGLDCSGLVQLAFRLLGVSLPRDAWQQQAVGEEVPYVVETKTGDLLFFHNDAGKVVHVAIVVNNTTAIHASGVVRYDRFDAKGLYQADTGLHTHALHSIKRIERNVY